MFVVLFRRLFLVVVVVVVVVTMIAAITLLWLRWLSLTSFEGGSRRPRRTGEPSPPKRHVACFTPAVFFAERF